jgi:hypothetical protein
MMNLEAFLFGGGGRGQQRMVFFNEPHEEDEEEHMEYPMRDAALDATESLFIIQHHMRKFIEASQSMKARVGNLPEQLRSPLGFEIMTSCAVDLSKKMEGFMGLQPVAMMNNLGDRLAKRKVEPITSDEWVRGWMRDKDLVDVSAPPEAADTCLYCATNVPNVIIRNCKCPCTSCASCMLAHYYRSTNQTQMSFSTCPTCRVEFTIGDIIPSETYFINDVIKARSTGKPPKKDTPLCGECKKAVGDSHIMCCKEASSDVKCAECLIRGIWENKYKHNKGDKACDHCRSTRRSIIVNRPFKFAAPTTPNTTKRKKSVKQ